MKEIKGLLRQKNEKWGKNDWEINSLKFKKLN